MMATDIDGDSDDDHIIYSLAATDGSLVCHVEHQIHNTLSHVRFSHAVIFLPG